jgi:hypothetical protein
MKTSPSYAKAVELASLVAGGLLADPQSHRKSLKEHKTLNDTLPKALRK